MSGTGPPWPVALLSGYLGSGKTTFVRALLTRPALRNTLVVVNEFGTVGIDHHLIEAVHGDVVLLRGGCLCCAVRQDLARTLRDVHLRWLGGRMPPFARVIVEASGLADPGTVAATFLTHPLLRDDFALRSVTTLVDAEHGDAQVSRHATSRRQVAAADRILLTKPDRAPAERLAALRERLAMINGLAAFAVSRFGNADPAPLFAPGALHRRAISTLRAAHDDAIASQVLTADTPLAWPLVQRCLAELLDGLGDRLLRLKGILWIADEPLPVVVQAVHESFYPIEMLPTWPTDRRESTLVLIVEGALPHAIGDAFARCRAVH